MFSIIIPVYNGEKYLLQCLNSIKDQSFNEYEVILINDESSDNSLNIMNQFKVDNPSLDITILDIKNEVFGPDRNLGMKYAIHDYIWFIDADDFLYDNDSFKRVADNINRYKPDIHIFSAFETDFNKRNKVWNFTRVNKLTSINKSPFLYLKQNWLWNKPFKRELVIDNNIKFDNIVFEDMYFFTKLYPKSKTIYISRDINYVYVKHSESITAKSSNFKGYPKALLNSFYFIIMTLIKKI